MKRHGLLTGQPARYVQISKYSGCKGEDVKPVGLTHISPVSPYQHLVDHEYGRTPQTQIIRQPVALPPRTQVNDTESKIFLEMK